MEVMYLQVKLTPFMFSKGVGQQAFLETGSHFQLFDHPSGSGHGMMSFFSSICQRDGEAWRLLLHEVPGFRALHEESFHLVFLPDVVGHV